MYHDISINIQQLSESLADLGQGNNLPHRNEVDENERLLRENDRVVNEKGLDESEETREDPLNEYRQAANETCLQSVLADYPVTTETNEMSSLGNEVYNIAPSENKHPVSIMTDKKCEELAFPVLFPKGSFC